MSATRALQPLSRLLIGALILAAVLVAVAPERAGAYTYRGGSSQVTERVPTSFSGGFYGSSYYYLDVNRASTNPQFPTPGNIRNNICGDLFDRRSVTPSQKEDCAKAIGAATLGVPEGQLASDRNNRVCFPLSGAVPSPCWTNTAKIWRNSLTNELHYSHYDANQVPVARSTIAWNVKVWRFHVQATGTVDRTPEPFFERRIDLNGGGDRNTSQLAWWYGGTGTSQNAAQNANGRGGWWWHPGRSAGPLGPGQPGTGATPAACSDRYNRYRQAYPEIGAPGSLANYLNASSKQHMCFWPSGINAQSGYAPQAIEFDRNQARTGMQVGSESVAFAWSFNRQGGSVNFDYKIQGQPGYVYMILVNSLDNREEIMGQYVKYFFADGWQPQAPDPCAQNDPSCVSTPNPTPVVGGGEGPPFAAPDVKLEGPDTAVTGRPAQYSLQVLYPEAKLTERQSIVVKRDRISVSDPNEKTGVLNPSSEEVVNQDYYNQQVTFSEVLGGGTDPAIWSPVASPEHTTSRSGLGARSSIQDALLRRDESGQFNNVAYIAENLPLAERIQNVAWLNPSDEPGAFASVFGEALYDSGTRAMPTARAYPAASAPQLPCSAGNANGEICVATDTTLRSWSADGTADERLNLSDHWTGAHQLASAYQWHPSRGAFILKLTTNRPDQVESLAIYDRASENGSLRTRVTSPVDGEWSIYFCRPGRWNDARIYRGEANNSSQANAFNTTTADANYGDFGCRRDFWRWTPAATPDEADTNACRATMPAWGATRSWLTRDGVPQAADLRGQLPNESVPNCTFMNSAGYVQDGRWSSTPWEWRWDSTDTCYGNSPANATVRYPDSPADGNGNRKAAPLPSEQGNRCRTAHPNGPAAQRNGHVDGYWFRGGYTWIWGQQCGKNAPTRPQPPTGWDNAGATQGYTYNGRSGKYRVGDRDNDNRLFYELTNGTVVSEANRPRCTFRDPSGFQWTGAFTRQAAEPGFTQVMARPNYDPARVDRGRFDGGQYMLVADFGTGASAATTWRMDTYSLGPKGSRWTWSANRWQGSSTVQTEVLSLQPTR